LIKELEDSIKTRNGQIHTFKMKLRVTSRFEVSFKRRTVIFVKVSHERLLLLLLVTLTNHVCTHVVRLRLVRLPLLLVFLNLFLRLKLLVFQLPQLVFLLLLFFLCGHSHSLCLYLRDVRFGTSDHE